MGKMPILNTHEESEDAWESANDNPDFFAADDDMYGNSVRVEADCTSVEPALPRTADASSGAVAGLVCAPGPGERGLVGIRRPNLVEGGLFVNCCSVTDLYRHCASDATRKLSGTA